MQLRHLLSKVSSVRQVRGLTDVEITSVCHDSRQAAPGALFVARRGGRTDGHDFLAQAIGRGAVALVVERLEAVVTAATEGPHPVTVVEVGDSRQALADLAAAFYGQPSHRLKVVGVTGTNGKTTTTFLLRHVLEHARLPCGLLGTVRYELGAGVSRPSARTTPESLEVQALLAEMRDAGCRAAVMEVSSHALALDRVRGVAFDAAVWTNLTQDHLDFHRDMAAYFEAKARLFLETLPASAVGKKRPTAVVNLDDRHGAQLLARLPKGLPVLTYGVGANAHFRASNFKTEFAGCSYQLDAQGRSFLVRLPLIGRFNILNSLAALTAAAAVGVPLREAVQALATAPAVPGRVQPVPVKRNFQVYVDYAHTPDALENVLHTLRELRPRRLITVFGCGGDRDRAKRPLMGRAAAALSDFTIVTSDNPRREDPAAIVRDIEGGFRGGNGAHAGGHSHEVVLDRREAIARAVTLAGPRDIVLIAGKGHEDYQEFADRTVPFDDVLVARQAVEARPVEMEAAHPHPSATEFSSR